MHSRYNGSSVACACVGLQASRMARGKLFDAALFAAAGLADGDTALRLLHRMWGERLPAGYLAHGHVIRALCNAKRFKVGLSATVRRVPAAALSMALATCRPTWWDSPKECLNRRCSPC